MAKSGELDGYDYGIEFLVGRKRPIPFLDHYHKADNATYSDSIRVQHAFKHGHPKIVKALVPLMARIAEQEFGKYGGPTHCVPTLGSSDLKADPASGTYQLAVAVADHLGIKLDDSSFYQTVPRESLHGSCHTRAQREEIVRSVLRVRGNISGRRYLAIDDIFTTGATMTVYAELMEQKRASLDGGVALFRYENSLPLRNPAIFFEAHAAALMRRLQFEKCAVPLQLSKRAAIHETVSDI